MRAGSVVTADSDEQDMDLVGTGRAHSASSVVAPSTAWQRARVRPSNGEVRGAREVDGCVEGRVAHNPAFEF